MLKQMIVAGALALAVSGCAQTHTPSAQEKQAQTTYDTYVNSTQAEVKAGSLTKLQGAERIADYVATNYPQDYAAQDAWNYAVKVYTDLEQSKVSEQEATYLIQKKRLDHEREYQHRVDSHNAGVDQQNNAALGVFMLGVGSAVQNAFPRPASPMNCVSTSAGNIINTNCY